MKLVKICIAGLHNFLPKFEQYLNFHYQKVTEGEYIDGAVKDILF